MRNVMGESGSLRQDSKLENGVPRAPSLLLWWTLVLVSHNRWRNGALRKGSRSGNKRGSLPLVGTVWLDELPSRTACFAYLFSTVLVLAGRRDGHRQPAQKRNAKQDAKGR